MRAAMASCQMACHLVHVPDASADVPGHDGEAARGFDAAAAATGVTRMVYLGGLGAAGDDLSEHLSSPGARIHPAPVTDGVGQSVLHPGRAHGAQPHSSLLPLDAAEQHVRAAPADVVAAGRPRRATRR